MMSEVGCWLLVSKIGSRLGKARQVKFSTVEFGNCSRILVLLLLEIGKFGHEQLRWTRLV